jgi:hypothetical protein
MTVTNPPEAIFTAIYLLTIATLRVLRDLQTTVVVRSSCGTEIDTRLGTPPKINCFGV